MSDKTVFYDKESAKYAVTWRNGLDEWHREYFTDYTIANKEFKKLVRKKHKNVLLCEKFEEGWFSGSDCGTIHNELRKKYQQGE